MKNKFNIPILTESEDDRYYLNYIDHFKRNSIRKFYRRYINHDRFGFSLTKRLKWN